MCERPSQEQTGGSLIPWQFAHSLLLSLHLLKARIIPLLQSFGIIPVYQALFITYVSHLSPHFPLSLSISGMITVADAQTR